MKKIIFLLWNIKNYGCNTKVFEYIQGLQGKGYAVEIYTFLGGSGFIEGSNLPYRSFFKLLFLSSPIDILIFSGFWPIAYLAILLRARRKIYYIQALDSDLHTNIILKFLVVVTYRLNFEKVVISHYLKEKLAGYSKYPIKVIPHGINFNLFSRYHLHSCALAEKKKLRVLSVVSNYHWIKGPDLLVKIIKELKQRRKDISFILISYQKYPYSPIFDEFISNLTPERMAKEYHQADLFLAASRQEGFFLPALEAMACKIPVVMTDCGGVREYVKDGYNCLLADNVSKIIKGRLVEYALDNKVIQKRLIRNGLLTAQKFSFSETLNRWIEYLDGRKNN